MGFSMGRPDELVVSPLGQLSLLGKPEWVNMVFAPRRGDAKTIEYEFVASVEDPFGDVVSPQLLVLKGDPFRPPPYGSPTNGRWGPMSEDAIVLNLVQGKPSEEALPYLNLHEAFAATPTWIARHEDANPGVVGAIRYFIQLRYQGKDGQWVHLPPRDVRFPSHVPGAVDGKAKPPGPKIGYPSGMAAPGYPGPGKPAGPDIPGLDGVPLDYPRPVKHAEGGYQITGPLTRVKEPAKAASGLALPKPSTSGQVRSRKPRRIGSWETVEIPVRPGNPLLDLDRASMVLSPDGK